MSKISYEELSELLKRFFESTDPFIQRSGYTVGIFKTQINKLRIGEAEEIPKYLRGAKETWDRIKREGKRNEGRRVPLLDHKVEQSVSK